MRYHDRTWNDQPRNMVKGLGVWILGLAIGLALGSCVDLAAPVHASSPRVFDDRGRRLVPVSCQFFAQAGGRHQYPTSGPDVVWIVAERWR